MAAKKSKKKSGGSGKKMPRGDAALAMLQDLLERMPDDVKMELLSSMMEGPPENFLMPERVRPRTNAQREIESLLNQARTQDSTNDALPYLRQAEAAAKKAIGKRFEKLVGQMGEDAAGQVYLDVKLELAQALNAAGQREAALEHVEETFRLDPEDPLEARPTLLAGYLDLDRNDDAQRLLDRACPEPWAAWNFSRLLLALRRGGRGGDVDEQLQAAHRVNPYVVSLLLGERMPDPQPPISLQTGEDSEAQELASQFLAPWRNTPGAISWLRDAVKRLGLEIEPPDAILNQPRSLSAREYAQMPPHPHPTWIAGVHDLGMARLPGEESPREHCLVFAFSPENDLVGFDVADKSLPPREVWDRFVEFMLDEERTGRPEKMVVYPPGLAKTLKKEAARAKIKLKPLEQAEQLSEMLGQLTDRMLGGAQVAESLDPEIIRQAPLNVDEVWEAAVVELEKRLNVGGHSLRPWVALVMSRGDGMILWHELFTESPPAGALANAVRMAIARPAVGSSRRPRQVVVRDHDEAISLAALSDEAGFLCTAERELPHIADALQNVTEQLLGGEPSVVLTKGEGTTPEDLERYYAAAAEYYRARPWKHFAMDEVIGLDASGPEGSQSFGKRHYGLVMGQSGITMGLAVYERLQDIEAMFADHLQHQVFDSYSVMYGEDASIAPADLDAVEQFGWPIATPEAYPDALRIHPGANAEEPRVETPTAEELRFLTAALQGIALLAQPREQKTAKVAVAGKNFTATRLGLVGAVSEDC